MAIFSTSNSLHSFALRDSSKDDECDGALKHDIGEPLSSGITTQRTLEYISAAALCLTVILSIGLILRHLARYTVPREQRQIVRIVFFTTFFALMGFLSVTFYRAAVYLAPIAGIYEAICLPALLILYFHYLSPVDQSLWNFFDGLQLTDRHGQPIQQDAVDWATRVWIFVFQYPFAMTVAAIIEIATEAAHRYCAGSLKPRYGHLWVQIISIVSVALAVPSLIRFQMRMKKYIDPKHKSGAKLWTLKGLIFLQFVQQIIFGLLNNHVFNPTAHVTYNDLYYGIPNTLTCLEAFLFALAFWWSYSPSEYHPDVVGTQGHKMAFWRACLDALDLSDLFAGVGTMFQLILNGASRSSADNTQYHTMGPLYSKGAPQQHNHQAQYDSTYGNGYPSEAHLNNRGY